MLRSTNDIDELLQALQSSDNAARSRAEKLLDEYSSHIDFITALMERCCAAPDVARRQLAASLLSWRMPRLWKQLDANGQNQLQVSLLKCFSSCHEPPVLRVLGEACNATCQQVAMHRDTVWQDLLQLLVSFLNGSSSAQRVAALDLFGSLVDSIGARLQPYHLDLSHVVMKCFKEDDVAVCIASLSLVRTVSISWCLSEADRSAWIEAGYGLFEVAQQALRKPAEDASKGPLLVACLRAASALATSAKQGQVPLAAAELASTVLNDGKLGKATDSCRTQALQVFRSLVRVAGALDQKALEALVPMICRAAKDEAPDLDDINEVSLVAQTARECIRVFVRADVARTTPLAFDYISQAMQSRDALDRAAAVHVVCAAWAGARTTAGGGPVHILLQGLEDSTVWVRHAVCDSTATLAECLPPSDDTSDALLMLLTGLCARLRRESAIELLAPLATAIRSVAREFSSDEIGKVLKDGASIPALGAVLSSTLAASSSSSSGQNGHASNGNNGGAEGDFPAILAALFSALGAVASAAMDLFAPFAVDAIAPVLQVLRARCGDTTAGIRPETLTAEVLAACLEASGSVLAAAWAEPGFQKAREDLVLLAHRLLPETALPSNVRAALHLFFASMALAAFEDFRPHLQPALSAASHSFAVAAAAGEAKSGRRAVRTGGQEELVAAITAVGAYAIAVGAHFAPHIQATLPSVCSHAQNPDAKVRTAVAESIERFGRMLGGLGEQLGPGPSQDRLFASEVARGLAMALLTLLGHQDGGASALRMALMVKEDLLQCQGFVELLGPDMVQQLSSACNGRSSDDVESSDGGDDDDEDDNEDM